MSYSLPLRLHLPLCARGDPPQKACLGGKEGKVAYVKSKLSYLKIVLGNFRPSKCRHWVNGGNLTSLVAIYEAKKTRVIKCCVDLITWNFSFGLRGIWRMASLLPELRSAVLRDT